MSACVIGEPGGQLSAIPLEPMVLAEVDRESGCLPGVPMGQLVARARLRGHAELLQQSNVAVQAEQALGWWNHPRVTHHSRGSHHRFPFQFRGF